MLYSKMYCSFAFALLLLVFSIEKTFSQYQREGDFIIGGIISSTKHCGSNSKTDASGIAFVEAIDFALDFIGKDYDFEELKQKIGYNIQNSCNDADMQKDIAKKLLQIPGHGRINAADIILAPFKKDSIETLKILNNAGIPQISYSSENVRLLQDYSVQDNDIRLLMSTSPDNTNKVRAVYDLIARYKFEFVYIISSDDAYGKAGGKVLYGLLEEGGNCKADARLVDDSKSIEMVLDIIQENTNTKVVVLHCSDHDIAIFREAQKRNMTDIIFISTYDWNMSLETLKSFKDVVDGMISINSRPYRGYPIFMSHLQGGLSRPYNEKPWLEKLYLELGGDTDTCYRLNEKTKRCDEADSKLRDLMMMERENVMYAMDAVYALAWALLKGGDQNLTESLKTINTVNKITRNPIIFNGSMAVQAYNFELYNLQWRPEIHAENVRSKRIGYWWSKYSNYGRVLDVTPLVKWKKGESSVPVIQCQRECPPGTYGMYLSQLKECCLNCNKCPKGLISNVTNAVECIKCPVGSIANAEQTSCEKEVKLHKEHKSDKMEQKSGAMKQKWMKWFGMCMQHCMNMANQPWQCEKEGKE